MREPATMRIAALQAAGVPGDVAANLALLAASCDGVDLVVTPELFVTGYELPAAALASFGREPLVARVVEIAAAQGVWIVAGLPLWEDGACWNAAAVVSPDGVVATYRKTHLFGPAEQQAFSPGSAPVCVFSLGSWRVGVLICYDVEFPEAVRALALAGAQVVVVPTAQMEPYTFVAEHLVRVRAWENHVFLAYVNHCGTETSLTYVGRSSIVGPGGEVLAAAGVGDERLVAELDPALIDRARAEYSYLDDRRPELYG